MLKKIIDTETLLDVSKTLLRKNFKPGFDGMSMEGASSWLFINGERLQRDIFNKNYRPMPAVGFRSAKTSGGFRNLARLTAIDTVIQTVLKDKLSPIAELRFSDGSFGYRQERGVHSAVKRYIELANEYRFVVKLDFESCFSNIDHGVLRNSVIDFFGNKELCDLIMLFAETPVYLDGEITKTEKGVLQGMPLAPLLCNVYLDVADKYFEGEGIPFVRYADDVVIFGDSLSKMNKAFSEAVTFFEEKLRLRCNQRKSSINSPIGITFLGHKFMVDKKGIIAFEAGVDTMRAYHNWHSNKETDGHGRVDLISDGILRQKDFSALFDTENVDTSIPLRTTNIINIYSDVVLDSGFLNLAMKNGITLNVFDKNGTCIGSIVPNKPLRSPKVTHEQLSAYYDERRLAFAKEFVLASIHNSLLNVRYYNKQNNLPLFEEAISKLEAHKAKVKTAKTHEKLLLLEAQCREIYYGCFDSFIKRGGFVFQKRTRRPPKNEVNALISFGNSVLYNLIACEISKTALDVRVGFLHSTNTRYASLNLDLAEIFKPLLVDRVVFTMINKGELALNMFEKCENDGVYLNRDAKHLFLTEFYEKLNTVITNKDLKMSYNTVIAEEVRKLVRAFRDKEKYKAFRQVR